MSSTSALFYYKMRHVLKTSVGYAAYLSGLIDSLAAYRTGIHGERRVIMIGYHRLVEDFAASSELAIPSLLISTITFRRQLELILKKFDCISLDDAHAAFTGTRTLKRDAVVITFDDGYEDFYQLGLPILKSYGLPATIYVTSGFIGKRAPFLHDQLYYLTKLAAQQDLSLPLLLVRHGFHDILPRVRTAWGQSDYFAVMRALLEAPREQATRIAAAIRSELNFREDEFPTDYRMLDWDMLRKINATGITIGAHSSSHVLLTEETSETAAGEIAHSKQELESALQIPIEHFAYPDGRYNNEIINYVRAAGFRTACTIEDRPNTLHDDIYRLKRKILWEHTCLGLFGDYSNVIAECQLRGLFANPAFKYQFQNSQAQVG